MLNPYQHEYDTITAGLSATARWILAIFAALIGIAMVRVAPERDHPVFSHVFGGFCLVIALACTARGRVRKFWGSIIGTTLMLLAVWYLYTQIDERRFLPGRRSEPNLVNAMLFTLAFGVPGGVYAFQARFGFGRDDEDERAQRDGS